MGSSFLINHLQTGFMIVSLKLGHTLASLEGLFKNTNAGVLCTTNVVVVSGHDHRYEYFLKSRYFYFETKKEKFCPMVVMCHERGLEKKKPCLFIVLLL